MAEENNEAEAPEEKKKSGLVGKLGVWGAIFVLGAGTGAAVPILTSTASGDDQRVVDVHGRELMDLPEAGEEVSFIEFDEVVLNLNDPRYSRYLSCSFSLQVATTQEAAITQLVDEKKVVLKNWLVSHIGDKTLDQVRGTFGQSMLRREINSKFNELLFTDGIERIQSVLFSDFKVQ
ncbi:MAG: flagellar basal body-associated FliL family protein [Planctomycetota bacterium]